MVTREAIQELIEKANDYSVSIYLPTHRKNEAAQQDPIRFKNLLNKAAEELSGRGLRKEQIDEMLKPARGLITKSNFWLHQSDGLCVFITPDHFEYHQVPISFDEFIYVDNRFFITPLMPMLARDRTFYVLALSQKNVGLLECTRDDNRIVELPDIPHSMEEFQRFDIHEKHLHSRPSGPGAVAFHGQGDAGDDNIKYIENFLKQVENGVTKYMKNQSEPLILAGVGEITSIYKKINHYNGLYENTVKGNTDEKNDKQIRKEAWKLIKPHLLRVIEDEKERYSDLMGSEKVSTNIEEVVKAAQYGKVETLFLPIGQNRWGKYDPENDQVLINGNRLDGDYDLFNYAATHTLTKKGQVFALDGEEMPDYSSIAAIFRY